LKSGAGPGLAWDGTHLWVSNIADAEHPETFWYRFYRFDPWAGAAVDSFQTWPSFYHGITWDGTHLWGEHNWDTISRLTTSGMVVEDLDAPAFFTFGAAYALGEEVLWVTVFQGATGLYKLDPATGNVLDILFPAETTTTHGWADLGWDGTFLWHSNVADDVVYKIDPVNGTIVESFAAPAPNCEGVAHDGWTLWLSSPTTDRIYGVDPGVIVDDAPGFARSASRVRLTVRPSPSRGPLEFGIDAPEGGLAHLDLYDVTGRLIAQLPSLRVAPGRNALSWAGDLLPAGHYIVRLTLGDLTASGRVVLIR
jgi:hypothetical protein